MTFVHQVVVTGLGAVSPLGHNTAAYWQNLKAGVSGLGPITLTPANEELTQKVAAEVKNFDPLQHFQERQLSTLDRVSQFAIVAARATASRNSCSLGRSSWPVAGSTGGSNR